MKLGLRTKVASVYALLIVVTLSVTYFGIDYTVKDTFGDYLERRIKQDRESIISGLSEAYSEDKGWDYAELSRLSAAAANIGMSITLHDARGNPVLSNSGMGRMGMGRMMGAGRIPYLTTESLPVLKAGSRIGTVDVSYQNIFLTEADTEFLDRINRFLIVSGLTIAAVAMILGVAFADSISKPILRVLALAQSLGKGDFSARIGQKDSTKEISQLYHGMNELAGEMGKQDAMRRRMAEDAAHELKTPLTIAKARLEAMSDGVLPIGQEGLAASISELDRLSDMLMMLEKVSRIESGLDSIVRKECSIAFTIGSAVEAMTPLFSAKGVDLILVDSGSEARMMLDCDKIRRAVENLLSNSLKYTDAGGSVIVTVSAGATSAEISVEDSGSGIDPNDLPHIFDRLYRADESRNRASGGMGIGLSLVRSIIEAHGGTVRAESEMGKGSKFIISLPSATD